MSMTEPRAAQALIDVARASAKVAHFCDRAEHVEVHERTWLIEAAQLLWDTFTALSAAHESSPREMYGRRLRQIELRNVLCDGSTGPAWQAECAETPRQLQLAQIAHDREFHPDVIGMAKIDQLRHYAFHLAKLCGHVAEQTQDGGTLDGERSADLGLFAVKLWTLCGVRMSDSTWI